MCHRDTPRMSTSGACPCSLHPCSVAVRFSAKGAHTKSTRPPGAAKGYWKLRWPSSTGWATLSSPTARSSAALKRRATLSPSTPTHLLRNSSTSDRRDRGATPQEATASGAQAHLAGAPCLLKRRGGTRACQTQSAPLVDCAARLERTCQGQCQQQEQRLAQAPRCRQASARRSRGAGSAIRVAGRAALLSRQTRGIGGQSTTARLQQTYVLLPWARSHRQDTLARRLPASSGTSGAEAGIMGTTRRRAAQTLAPCDVASPQLNGGARVGCRPEV